MRCSLLSPIDAKQKVTLLSVFVSIPVGPPETRVTEGRGKMSANDSSTDANRFLESELWQINHEMRHKTKAITTINSDHQTNSAMPRPNNSNTNNKSSNKDLAVYGNLFSCKYHGGAKSKRAKEQKRLDAYGNLFSVANRN
jgi:hypothetical protein